MFFPINFNFKNPEEKLYFLQYKLLKNQVYWVKEEQKIEIFLAY